MLRGQNSYADSLATLASSMDNYVPHLILVEVLHQSSIEHQQCVSILSTPTPSLMNPIIAFIMDGVLPSQTKKAEKIQRILA